MTKHLLKFAVQGLTASRALAEVGAVFRKQIQGHFGMAIGAFKCNPREIGERNFKFDLLGHFFLVFDGGLMATLISFLNFSMSTFWSFFLSRSSSSLVFFVTATLEQ